MSGAGPLASAVAAYRCWCTGADGAAVARAVAGGAANLEAVRRATGACTRCGSCRPELEAALAALQVPPPASGAVTAPSARR